MALLIVHKFRPWMRLINRLCHPRLTILTLDWIRSYQWACEAERESGERVQ